MKHFLRALKAYRPTGARRWLFVPYDQLSGDLGPLAREEPDQLGIILLENRWQARRRPYHRQKLALLWANQRHFALEQAAWGVAVRYEVVEAPFREALRPFLQELGSLRVMEPAERELRADLEPLRAEGLEILPHEGWLTTAEQFQEALPSPPWRMDRFYRHVRRATGVLMPGGKPAGGKYSFDPENREPWRGHPPAPDPPRFPHDPIKEEVAELIATEFSAHPGEIHLDSLSSTQADAETAWEWAKRHCLPQFGPYEDAMSAQSTGLFHTRLSALINLHRLLPSRVTLEAEQLRLPLPSKEGFIRQVLGWREYVRHVHTDSDGFRALPEGTKVEATSGDAGYARWAGRPWAAGRQPDYLDGGAAPCALGCDRPLPPAYWGAPSGMRCLDLVVAGVWKEGWSHHITRLVVLSGIAALLDFSPRELTDWFWIAYADAYDWVVEPNVLGMGLFAIGDLMSTKPYVTGASYINKMSDYCPDCQFSPRRNCPLTPLYWAFLNRHRRAFAGNPRLALPLASAARRTRTQRRRDQGAFARVSALLAEGKPLALADAASWTER